MFRHWLWVAIGGLAFLGTGLWYSCSDYRLDTAWELDSAEQAVSAVAGKEVEATFRLRNVASRGLRICGASFC